MPRHRSSNPATQKGLRSLTHREENFIREYFVGFNAGRAALKAGYSARGARVTASRLLSKPHIIGALQALRDEQAQRLQISAENVLDELGIVGFADMGEFWPKPGERIDLSRMPRRQTAAVQSIKIKETIGLDKDGHTALLERTTELRLYNKTAALEKLALHLGLFDRSDKDSLADRVRKMTPEERVARLEQIMRIARERYGHLIEAEGEEIADQDGDQNGRKRASRLGSEADAR